MTDNPPALVEHAPETALPAILVETARDYQRVALAERTRQTYADAFRLIGADAVQAVSLGVIDPHRLEPDVQGIPVRGFVGVDDRTGFSSRPRQLDP